MRTIRNAVAVLLLAVLPVLASAQGKKIPQRIEISSLEIEDVTGTDEIEVFNSPANGANHYYLSAGRPGIGDKVVQVMIDPASELFIYLGDTLEDAIKTLEGLKALFKNAPEEPVEYQGCLCVGFPKENLEPVSVSLVKVLLSKNLQFSVKRGEYYRAAYVSKSSVSSMLSGAKFYRKLHPKE